MDNTLPTHTHTHTHVKEKMLCFSFLFHLTAVPQAQSCLNKRTGVRINLLTGCWEGRCGLPLLTQAENKHSTRGPSQPSAARDGGGMYVLLG